MGWNVSEQGKTAPNFNATRVCTEIEKLKVSDYKRSPTLLYTYNVYMGCSNDGALNSPNLGSKLDAIHSFLSDGIHATDKWYRNSVLLFSTGLTSGDVCLVKGINKLITGFDTKEKDTTVVANEIESPFITG